MRLELYLFLWRFVCRIGEWRVRVRIEGWGGGVEISCFNGLWSG